MESTLKVTEVKTCKNKHIFFINNSIFGPLPCMLYAINISLLFLNKILNYLPLYLSSLAHYLSTPKAYLT